MKAIIFYMLILVVSVSNVYGAEKRVVPSYEDEFLKLRLVPRTAEQMAGFYEARGFPVAMVDELSQHCFFTVIIKNKSKSIVWLDMSQWGFFVGEQKVLRFSRNYWPPKWVAMKVPLSAQSTFRWTLLPEKLDFQPDESEGGNIILEKTNQHFSLTARFGLGEAGEGGVRVAKIDHLECVFSPTEKKP